jgi:Flp pilus assembly protein TadD
MQLKWILSHVRGYLELGLIDEADAELELIPANAHDHVEVRGLRAAIQQQQQRWPELKNTTERLAREHPDDPGWWIMWAYATRRADSLDAAERILQEALRLHPKDPTILFNLGCYACQQGRNDAARSFVDSAIALDDRFSEAAATDPDLAPLRTAELHD